jgi:hypothetical protein
MTGNVPYYGGRFTPAQAYAASHPSQWPGGPGLPVSGATAAGRPPMPPGGAGSRTDAESRADPLAALQHLLDIGVITAAEYEELRARVVA